MNLSSDLAQLSRQLSIPSDKFGQVLPMICRNFIKKYEKNSNVNISNMAADLKKVIKQIDVYSQYACDAISKYQSLNRLETLVRGIFQGQTHILIYVANIITENLNDQRENRTQIDSMTYKMYEKCANCQNPIQKAHINMLQNQICMSFKDEMSYFQTDLNQMNMKIDENTKQKRQFMLVEPISELDFHLKFMKINQNIGKTIDHVTQSLNSILVFREKFLQFQENQYETSKKQQKENTQNLKFNPKKYMVDMSKHFYNLVRRVENKMNEIKKYVKNVVSVQTQTFNNFHECTPEKLNQLKQNITKLEIEKRKAELYSNSLEQLLSELKTKVKTLQQGIVILNEQKVNYISIVKDLQMEIKIMNDREAKQRRKSQMGTSMKLIDPSYIASVSKKTTKSKIQAEAPVIETKRQQEISALDAQYAEIAQLMNETNGLKSRKAKMLHHVTGFRSSSTKRESILLPSSKPVTKNGISKDESSQRRRSIKFIDEIVTDERPRSYYRPISQKRQVNLVSSGRSSFKQIPVLNKINQLKQENIVRSQKKLQKVKITNEFSISFSKQNYNSFRDNQQNKKDSSKRSQTQQIKSKRGNESSRNQKKEQVKQKQLGWQKQFEQQDNFFSHLKAMFNSSSSQLPNIISFEMFTQKINECIANIAINQTQVKQMNQQDTKIKITRVQKGVTKTKNQASVKQLEPINQIVHQNRPKNDNRKTIFQLSADKNNESLILRGSKNNIEYQQSTERQQNQKKSQQQSSNLAKTMVRFRKSTVSQNKLKNMTNVNKNIIAEEKQNFQFKQNAERNILSTKNAEIFLNNQLKQVQNQHFTKQDIKIVFGSLENAYNSNLLPSQKSRSISLQKNKSINNLSSKEISYVNQFCTKLATIHVTNLKNYQKIKLFLLYPFDSVVSQMSEFKLGKGGNSNDLRQVLHKILVYHRSCVTKGQICKHLKHLFSKINKLETQK